MPAYIKKIAIEKCDSRLASARSSLAACKSATSFNVFSKHWTDFLTHATAVIHILEGGAKHTPQAKQWYGAKRRIGRADPLVSYMVQARNADEHGIEPIAELAPGSLAIGAPGERVQTMITTDSEGNFTIHGPNRDGSPLTITVTSPHPRLVAVHDDRFKTSFDPPTEHLGKPIKCAEVEMATHVGGLYLSYVSALTREAETLC